MINEPLLRDQLSSTLGWEDAHVGFDNAVDGIPAELRGTRPSNLPHSPWQLIEHLRIAQHDILEFCRNPSYKELKWPDGYWPASDAPPSARAWDESIRMFRQDRKALQQLAADLAVDLTARIPHGDGQTYVRELILAADHAAYHLGELIVVRRLLGIWKSK
ncbi:MAG: DinB family protein [Thermoanaerobaculia bacterium]